MSIYFVTIKSGDSYWVISSDPTSAYEKLLKMLDENDIYFSSERELVAIEVIANESLAEGVYDGKI